ncbi:30S ribosomal protein S7 [Candidatus Roizmanbacteria bacterium CG_4_9_14_0_2_um_filter_39_13]|uniref:Small ribosomal subunit protein uS7 n=2 Tax=Candidatus Roizmaniibacteriota TaxID=1752723 RepID=A0A2M8EWG3_9BACT|nr:MAG: 30S ribosomal protein S7 [Candidatus Roizmanbacteria bacterium CG_4_10_14_0_2_um_filter_39_12]PJC30208.1 MAG: 30S ribosomal protein S7 [Candidatus Roizmanbacteria bacterium CG_4_9_14_0_2_um_filter_39_13]PJE62039.1 MAG: 30S ribosomal protein S7 [Candidatus Roizmanbacteria bacterium CG10_big_fil_rev_8_21_14_0_10_39_12]
MPRHQYKRQKAGTDSVFESLEVSKLINYIMKDGKKTVARELVYSMLENIKGEDNDPLVTLNKAISNVTPDKEVRSRRLGGASYLVPTDIREDRKIYLALNWIIDAARTRSNKEFNSFDLKLAEEVKEAAKRQGPAFAKRQQTEKLASQNKAFSHLKW